jgi:hypothetical protein
MSLTAPAPCFHFLPLAAVLAGLGRWTLSQRTCPDFLPAPIGLLVFYEGHERIFFVLLGCFVTSVQLGTGELFPGNVRTR